MDSPPWFAKLLLPVRTGRRALFVFYKAWLRENLQEPILLDGGVTKIRKTQECFQGVLHDSCFSWFLRVDLLTLFCLGRVAICILYSPEHLPSPWPSLLMFLFHVAVPGSPRTSSFQRFPNTPGPPNSLSLAFWEKTTFRVNWTALNSPTNVECSRGPRSVCRCL